VASAFAELGLGPALVAAVEAEGYEDPTPLQRAAIPVIRRSGNAVLRASTGAGVTAAWALGLLDRLSSAARPEAAGPRALVLVGTAERASQVAETLARLGARANVSARALAAGWRRAPVDVLVAPVEAAVRGVSDSTLKLDAVGAVVVDGLSALLGIAGTEALDTVLVTVPGDAQRIVTTADVTKDVERFVQAHVRRALEIPARAAEPPTPAAPPARGALSFMVVSESDKTAALAELLGRPAESPPVVIARTAARADGVRDALRLRGFALGTESGEPGVTVSGALDAARATIAYDVPADAHVLERMEPGSGVVLVTPAELSHLRALAAETGFTLTPLERRVRRGGVAAFRERVRRAIAEHDLDAQLLVLDPLLQEHSAAEVAAALSALLRAREPLPEPATAEAEAAAKPAPFVRLFIGIGQRDGVRPADIVGAVTGEARIAGEQIGRIEVRDTFTVVEVDSSVAERVIRALNGTTMRGRSLRVDFDRKTAAPPRRGRPARPG
jgi:ATP-dependent RNA helicase DeaD